MSVQYTKMVYENFVSLLRFLMISDQLIMYMVNEYY